MKTKKRRMKLALSCKRRGVPPTAFEISWEEPEKDALDTFEHFHDCLRSMLKAHGLMLGEATAPEDIPEDAA